MTSRQHRNKRVPSDFPHPCGGSVGGAQNKLLARKAGGRFVVSMSGEELWERYDACEDLVTNVAECARRKRSQYAELSLSDFLRRLRAGVVSKGWDLTSEELDWVMERVATAMGGVASEAVRDANMKVTFEAGSSASAVEHVESVVDRACARLR